MVADGQRLDERAEIGGDVAERVRPARADDALLGEPALLAVEADEPELAADVVAADRARGTLAAHVVGLDGDPVALGERGHALPKPAAGQAPPPWRGGGLLGQHRPGRRSISATWKRTPGLPAWAAILGGHRVRGSAQPSWVLPRVVWTHHTGVTGVTTRVATVLQAQGAARGRRDRRRISTSGASR